MRGRYILYTQSLCRDFLQLLYNFPCARLQIVAVPRTKNMFMMRLFTTVVVSV